MRELLPAEQRERKRPKFPRRAYAPRNVPDHVIEAAIPRLLYNGHPDRLAILGQCEGIARSTGERCQLHPLRGEKFCAYHGTGRELRRRRGRVSKGERKGTPAAARSAQRQADYRAYKAAGREIDRQLKAAGATAIDDALDWRAAVRPELAEIADLRERRQYTNTLLDGATRRLGRLACGFLRGVICAADFELLRARPVGILPPPFYADLLQGGPAAKPTPEERRAAREADQRAQAAAVVDYTRWVRTVLEPQLIASGMLPGDARAQGDAAIHSFEALG